jgi:hypothetical protein
MYQQLISIDETPNGNVEFKALFYKSIIIMFSKKYKSSVHLKTNNNIYSKRLFGY